LGEGRCSFFNAIQAVANLWGGLAYSPGSHLSYTPVGEGRDSFFNAIQMAANLWGGLAYSPGYQLR